MRICPREASFRSAYRKTAAVFDQAYQFENTELSKDARWISSKHAADGKTGLLVTYGTAYSNDFMVNRPVVSVYRPVVSVYRPGAKELSYLRIFYERGDEARELCHLLFDKFVTGGVNYLDDLLNHAHINHLKPKLVKRGAVRNKPRVPEPKLRFLSLGDLPMAKSIIGEPLTNPVYGTMVMTYHYGALKIHIWQQNKTVWVVTDDDGELIYKDLRAIPERNVLGSWLAKDGWTLA